MVSNQMVTRVPGRLIRLAGGVALLSLAAGCQYLHHEDAPPPPEPVAAAPVAAPEEPTNAIEAALAREGTGAATQSAPQSAPTLLSSAPKSYTVKRGDTLWGISAMYLRDPWLWPEIWHVNPAIENPHLIYPGDVLTLAYSANGAPQVTLMRGNVVHVQPLVRGSPIDGPISTIPYEAIRAFLGRPTMVSKEDLSNAPCVIGFPNSHMADTMGHKVYIKGLKNHSPGRFTVVRIGQEMVDPETGKVLGYMGTYAASARVDEIGKVSSGMLTESARETVVGDLVFPEESSGPVSDIVPHAPPSGIDGQIMAVMDGVELIGQYTVVAINRGTKNGLETGHVLAIDQKGEVVNDRPCNRYGNFWCRGRGQDLRLPSERAGTLLVFKTYEHMSYGLVVDATGAMRVADYVHGP
ncbi:MAG: LysM peptidoglycan-binding domain-containing protein [Pseudomonadota bacterium]